MKVPDGGDYVAFMLYAQQPPPDRRGVQHHLCLEIEDAEAAVARLNRRPYRQGYTRDIEIRTGINRKRQVNLYDPDGTRIELMEPDTIDGVPALGGLLIATVGLPATFAAETVCFLLAVVFMRGIPEVPIEGGTRRLEFSSVVEGFKYLKGRRVILAAMWIDLSAMVFGMPTALFPAIGTELFGGNAFTVGLLLFTDRIEHVVPPGKGRRHVLRLIRDLFVHAPQSRGTAIKAALDHTLHVLRRRAIVVLVSDFLDAGYEKTLRTLAQKHDVVAVRLLDPREAALPAVGLLTLEDAETGRPVLVDTSSRATRAAAATCAAHP